MKRIILTNKIYLSLMFPFIISTITQPLLGAVDLAVIGHLSNENLISGVAIGTLIFNTIYWLFGFLRVSTTACSAQLFNKSLSENANVFFRNIIIAFCIGIILIFFQNIVFDIIIKFISPEDEIKRIIYLYFEILILGAPFVLINYVVLGWMMGKGEIKSSLVMQISGNIINILLDIIFVTIFKLDVQGVAYATLISQLLSTVIGIFFIFPKKFQSEFKLVEILKKDEIFRIFLVNKNLMIRTVFLLLHNNLIMKASSTLGSDIVAVNSILLQIVSIISYAFDGIANTTSVFSGRAKGMDDNNLMKEVWKKNLLWGSILVLITTVGYFIFYDRIITMFTNIEKVIIIASQYKYWVGLYPIFGFLGLTYYGVFTGTNITYPVAVSTCFAFFGFILSYKFLIPILKNNGIWFSLLSFYFFRGVFLLPYLKLTLSKKEEEYQSVEIGKFNLPKRREN